MERAALELQSGNDLLSECAAAVFFIHVCMNDVGCFSLLLHNHVQRGFISDLAGMSYICIGVF